MTESTDEQAAEVHETVLDAQTGGVITIEEMYAQSRKRVAEQLVATFSDQPEKGESDELVREIELGLPVLSLMMVKQSFDEEKLCAACGHVTVQPPRPDLEATAPIDEQVYSLEDSSLQTTAEMYLDADRRVIEAIDELFDLRQYDVTASSGSVAADADVSQEPDPDDKRQETADGENMDSTLTDDSVELTAAEKDKPVVTLDGQLLGTVTNVKEGEAYVELSAEATEAVMSALDWAEDVPLRPNQIARITEDEVVLNVFILE